MQMHGLDIPIDEDGADRPIPHSNLEMGGSQIEQRKYPPHE